MFNIIKGNISVLCKYFLGYCSAIFALIEIILIFVSLDDFGIDSKLKKIIFLCVCVLISVILSILSVVLRNKKQIFGDINRGLIIRYGDIIKLAFTNRNPSKKIIVIPVNRCFDMSCKDNLIAKRSIHGQWINSLIKDSEQRTKLNNYIQKNLSERQIPYTELTKESKKAGNLKRYKSGSVVEIPYNNNTTFYLLAFAELDQNLKAQCTEIEFYRALSGLLEYYDSNSQGTDLYCPVMGDHIVNPCRDTKSIIDFMISVLKFNKSKIRGKMNIVVYYKLKSTISILDV